MLVDAPDRRVDGVATSRAAHRRHRDPRRQGRHAGQSPRWRWRWPTLAASASPRCGADRRRPGAARDARRSAARGQRRQALAPLLAIATVVTPNLDELAALTADHVAHDADTMRGQARRLKQFGPRAVLAKGGHLEGDIVDILVDDEGDTAIRGQRIEGVDAARHRLRALVGDRLPPGLRRRRCATPSVGACDRVRLRIAEARAVGKGRPFLGLRVRLVRAGAALRRATRSAPGEPARSPRPTYSPQSTASTLPSHSNIRTDRRSAVPWLSR